MSSALPRDSASHPVLQEAFKPKDGWCQSESDGRFTPIGYAFANHSVLLKNLLIALSADGRTYDRTAWGTTKVSAIQAAIKLKLRVFPAGILREDASVLDNTPSSIVRLHECIRDLLDTCQLTL